MDTQTLTHIQAQLHEAFGDEFKLNEPMHRYTTARVGGPAEMFVTVFSAAELQRAVDLAYAAGIPWLILGGGSNMLVADQGVDGLVILNKSKKISFRHNGVTVICTADSGVNLSALARQCISRGLGGLEWSVSVPGTVGGAVVGNSGAHGSDMSNSLLTAQIWEAGQVRTYANRELAFGYRTSRLKQEGQSKEAAPRVVLSVDLQLRPEPAAVLEARAAAFITHRKETQPGGASMGSMFKNPEHYYAGYLIDAAGLKGLRHGGARISEKHANFFINEGSATAEDIRGLMAEAWHAVHDQFGVDLQVEVQLVGRWRFDDDQE